jgi:hypothetical protein
MRVVEVVFIGLLIFTIGTLTGGMIEQKIGVTADAIKVECQEALDGQQETVENALMVARIRFSTDHSIQWKRLAFADDNGDIVGETITWFNRKVETDED